MAPAAVMPVEMSISEHKHDLRTVDVARTADRVDVGSRALLQVRWRQRKDIGYGVQRSAVRRH